MRLVLNTNIWISYMIASRREWLFNEVINHNLTIITNDTLVSELKDVLGRPKIRKYLRSNVDDEINFHLKISEKYPAIANFDQSPDPNDIFLFDLAIQARCSFVVTGDKNLLMSNDIAEGFKFISRSEFEKSIQSI